MFEYKVSDKKLIIDSGSILFSGINPNKLLDENQNPIKEDGKYVYYDKTWEEVEYHLSNLLIGIFNNLNAGEYIGFVDNTRLSESLRRKVNSSYKSNREGKEAPKWLREAKEYLINSWSFVSVTNGYEADDMCRIHQIFYKEDHPILISVDKDILFTEGITYDPRGGTIRTNELQDEELALWKSMIIGDSADNIIGLKGKGKVFAAEFFVSLLLDPLDPGAGFRIPLKEAIFKLYIDTLGLIKGTEEFYKNLYCLYIRRELSELGTEDTISEFIRVPGTY